MRFAYADPPYYGLGERLYGYPEWDDKERHYELLSVLREDFPDGWALSCNPRDLGWLLPACESRWSDVRVAAWTKTYHQWRNVSVQYAWEPVLFRGGRRVLRRNPMIRDWFACASNHRGGLVGSKPEPFCSWVLDMLGFEPEQDELEDVFPGTGVMARVVQQGKLPLLSDAKAGAG